MARIPVVDPDDAGTDATSAAILHRIREQSGRDSNVYGAIANHPTVFPALVEFSRAVYKENSLPPGERELAYLATSVANDCFY